MDNFIPIESGFPGNKRLMLISELNELLKYCSLIGSKLFFVVLSEMKFTFEEKFQYGFDFASLGMRPIDTDFIRI